MRVITLIKSNELLKDDHKTAFSQQLTVVLQNLKFGPNMGLNVPTPFCHKKVKVMGKKKTHIYFIFFWPN